MSDDTKSPSGLNEQQYEGSKMYGIGKIGEEFVLKFLKGEGFDGICDKGSDPKYWKNNTTDIEARFIGYVTKDGKPVAIEVKTDTWILKSGNFACETFRYYFEKEEMVPGWGLRLRCHFLFQVALDANNEVDTIYIVSRKQWNDAVIKFMENMSDYLQGYDKGMKLVKTDKEKKTYISKIPITLFNLPESQIFHFPTQLNKPEEKQPEKVIAPAPVIKQPTLFDDDEKMRRRNEED